MQLSSSLLLSGLAMLSTSAAAPNAVDARQERVATFETYTVPRCDSDVGRVQYQRVTPGECRTLAPAQSIKVFYTSLPSCRVNTFSGAGCSGDLTQYQFTNPNAPCLLINNKVSYNITC